jgi:hypothetical protein
MFGHLASSHTVCSVLERIVSFNCLTLSYSSPAGSLIFSQSGLRSIGLVAIAYYPAFLLFGNEAWHQPHYITKAGTVHAGTKTVHEGRDVYALILDGGPASIHDRCCWKRCRFVRLPVAGKKACRQVSVGAALWYTCK